MGVFFILVVDRMKMSLHILTFATLLIVIVMIKMMFCKDVILLVKRQCFLVSQNTGYIYAYKNRIVQVLLQ